MVHASVVPDENIRGVLGLDIAVTYVSTDPGELKAYLSRLWLFSSDGIYLHQTWKNSYGVE